MKEKGGLLLSKACRYDPVGRARNSTSPDPVLQVDRKFSG